MKPAHTLADCTVPIPLRCMHCDQEFPMSAPIELFDVYVVVECRKCHLMTPFKLEKSA
ncbi:MAG TPA: hypothetical protein VFF58_00510 [Candidatus Nitrosotalea sp.]|nr:hypothetical protein [Candidatus Nitrosotalea sp.]